MQSDLNHIRIIKRHAKSVGFKPLKEKDLRYSHASFLINKYNANPLIIRDRLGYEDIQTTLGTYGPLYPNMNREVANRLKNVINVQHHKIYGRKLISNQFVDRNIYTSNFKSFVL